MLKENKPQSTKVVEVIPHCSNPNCSNFSLNSELQCNSQWLSPSMAASYCCPCEVCI